MVGVFPLTHSFAYICNQKNIMVERIRNLLETRQLTPTQFADLIGVARPIVSHILSGRNKPSLEVVQRVLAALPDLSMPWLLNGAGPMYAVAPSAPSTTADKQHVGVTQAAEVVPASRAAPPIAATTPPLVVASSHTVQIAASFSAVKPTKRVVIGRPTPQRFTPKVTAPQPAFTAPETTALANETRPPVIDQPQPAPEVESLPVAVVGAVIVKDDASIATALFAGAEKPIRRIVVFYRDGSFADYQPE